MSAHIISLKISGKALPCSNRENNLLELLESNQVPVEYQCRSGYCGACRLTLLKGAVVYRQPPLASINEGEILPCCCTASMDLELEI
ncbi:class I ribonucleotide reductase maintenance protein YfaE [Serratia microhaemolytica]|uniref:class I ribonucleotide reductase maintenance protein YfaE n=1 Tax=Serratia microhaemolytica TaxID=2675110 RepID=UPI000FDF0260|nr:class I ribonucleotide reductase maintenance protein YfaE [Serratia microhaemolytica]